MPHNNIHNINNIRNIDDSDARLHRVLRSFDHDINILFEENTKMQRTISIQNMVIAVLAIYSIVMAIAMWINSWI